jgi:hypothetical protein
MRIKGCHGLHLAEGARRDQAQLQLGTMTTSDTTEIRGACGHKWINFGAWMTGQCR